MKKIILITLILILSACTNSSDWYLGTWEFDLEKTNKFSENLDKKQTKLLQFYTSFDKGYKITVTKTSLIVEYNGKVAPEQPYTLVEENNSQYKFENKRVPLVLGKDNNGIYSLVRKEVKTSSGAEVLSTDKTEVKVYLKPVN